MLEQARAAWQNLPPRQRAILGLAAIIGLAGLAAVGYWSAQPTYSVLYGGLAPEDAAAVVQELRTQKTPYRIGAAGNTIEVPQGALYETRLSLAGKGMPTRNGMGFELFDRSVIPGTDFSNTVNLQRALQGELARTICSLSQVKSARVHLALPHESLFSDPSPPTASVLLDLGGAGSLAPSQVRGISYLVASAVSKLTPQNVTIVDTQGNVLKGVGSAGGDLDDTALATAKQYSEALSARLQTMLDAVFGAHRTIVKAQAELDLDSEETNEETLQPAAPAGQKAVAHEHTTQETYTGVGGAAGALPGGLLGGARAVAPEGGGNYKNTEETREYEFSKKTTRKQVRPGRVRRLAVAAVVDPEVAAAGVDRVQQVLAAAAGIDLQRGDTIVVQPMKLKAAELADTEAKELAVSQVAERRQRLVEVLVQKGLPFVVALVLLAALVRTAGEFRRAASFVRPAGSAAEPGVSPASPAPGSGLAAAVREVPRIPPTAEQQEEEALVEELRRLAREQPDALAEELRMLVSGPDNP